MDTLYRFLLVVTVCLIANFDGKGQVSSKFTYELGTGVSLLGTGDAMALHVENALNIKINQKFEVAGALVFGRGIPDYNTFSISFFQGNANLYLVPFGNHKKIVFKLGVGASYHNHNEVSSLFGKWEEGKFIVGEYLIRNDNLFGYNLIIENQYNISEKFSIILKLFGQRYSNGDTNFGGNLKLGYNF